MATGPIVYEQKFIYNLCKCAHIEDVCVRKEYRNQGLGKQIMLHLIEDAKVNKCYKICLVCSKDTTPFYMSCCFEERGVQMSYLIDGK